MWSFPGSYANRGSETEQASSDVADRVGFEPTSLLRDYLISSPVRKCTLRPIFVSRRS